MCAIIAVQAWPLAWLGAGHGGLARLLRLLGVGAPPIAFAAWALALAVAVVYAALSMRSLPYIRRHALDLTALKLLAVLFAFVTGTFEELFFRKWLMDWLATSQDPLLAQILVSGVVFGAAHAIWGLFGGSVRTALTSMLYTTGLGIALAVVYVVAGRQLAPAVWSHILINLIIEPWLILGVMSLRDQAETPVAA